MGAAIAAATVASPVAEVPSRNNRRGRLKKGVRMNLGRPFRISAGEIAAGLRED
jgi:hypothetical protein